MLSAVLEMQLFLKMKVDICEQIFKIYTLSGSQ